MRQDILTKQSIDRRIGGSFTYKMERGVAGELLFINSGGSWNYKDIITAKLRSRHGGVVVVIDRVPALLLAWLCDTKKGRPSSGTFNTAGEEGEEQTSETIINAGQPFFVNAFKISVGHISLGDAESELEITVDVAKAFGGVCNFKLANIEPKSGPDYINQYDKSFDLESTHSMVRELWLYGKTGNSFFHQVNGNAVSGKDISVMLYPSESSSYETDVETLGANTSIDGELSHSVTNLLCAYQDGESLPTPSLRVKITGDDSHMVGMLFIKEKMIQGMTSVSTIDQIDKTLKKTEAIEKADPQTAKAYRHAGATHHSSQLFAVKSQAEAKTPEAK